MPARFEAFRRELLDPRVATREGRIVKTMEDGVLVEFSSAVESVLGAVEVRKRNIILLVPHR